MNLILKNNKKQSENKLVKFLTRKLKLIIFMISLFCLILSLPKCLCSTVRSQSLLNETTNQSDFVYFVDRSDLNFQTKNLIFKISFYSNAIFGKILPSICLAVFISMILSNMITIKKNKQRLSIASTQVRKNNKIHLKNSIFKDCYFLY